MKTFPKLDEKYQNQTPTQEKTSCFFISSVRSQVGLLALWLVPVWVSSLASLTRGPPTVSAACRSVRRSHCVEKTRNETKHTSVRTRFSSRLNEQFLMFDLFLKHDVWTLIHNNKNTFIVLLAHIDLSFTWASKK